MKCYLFTGQPGNAHILVSRRGYKGLHSYAKSSTLWSKAIGRGVGTPYGQDALAQDVSIALYHVKRCSSAGVMDRQEQGAGN